MNTRFARSVFALIAVVALAATAFRIASGPDRVRERRNTAQEVCLATGGSWVMVDDEEICDKPEMPAKIRV